MDSSAISPYLLGIDLGGSSVKTVAVTHLGDRLHEWNRPFDPDRPLHFAETIRQLLREASDRLGPPARIGLSAPGLPASDGRSIAVMPGRLAGLEGLCWTTYLGSPTEIPVLNDAQAALLGETWLGAARGSQNVALLTLGTGVGGAAMVDGRLLQGHSGKAGHFGHLSLNPEGSPDICGTPGSLEDAIGNHNIVARSLGRFPTTHALVAAVASGDESAALIWNRSLRALAAAIVSLTNILDPEIVLIGGGIASAGPALFEPLQHLLAAWEWRPTGVATSIRPTQLGDLAGAYGAARHAALAVG
jgi:glucokinase